MDMKKVGISIGIVVLVAALVFGIVFFLVPKEEKEVFYKVTFNNEGTSKVVYVEPNQLVVEPMEPEKEGYTFEGWYYNGTKFDFTTGVTLDIVLEARWISDSAKKWIVSFDSAGGKHIESLNVVDGEKIEEIPTPIKEGYEFIGWYYNNQEYDFNTPVTKDITLLAKWEKEETEEEEVTEYTVKFNTDGGNTIKSQTVEENKTIIKPSDPIKKGYVFTGWYYNGTKFDFSTKITKNITLTAKWKKVETPDEPAKPKTYTVKFNVDGGSSVSEQKVTEGNTVNKPNDPVKEGYKFIGWYYNNVQYNFNTTVTSDVTLVAKWEKNAVITYSIEEIPESYVGQVRIFVLKDGVKVDGIVDITTTAGKVVTNKEIPKDGYVTNGSKIQSITNVRVK